MDALLLRAAIKRGFLLVAGNWPVILIDFAVDSFCRLALVLPVIGGALMVTTVAGIDVSRLLSRGVLETADLVIGSLASAPLALAAFLAAVAVVAVGGEAVRFIVKAGTLSVIVRADWTAGDVHHLPVSVASLRRTRVFGLEVLVQAGGRFLRRGVLLSFWLAGVYGTVAGVYLGLVTWGLPGSGSVWLPAWSALVLLTTGSAIVVIGAANLGYTLLRIVIVTDDCGIAVAIGRLKRFVIEDARQVIGVFAVITGIELLAGAAALVAAAGLAPIAYLPVTSLVLLPLQAALWLTRGLVFEALSLTGVAAYQTQYRRFSQQRWGATGVLETAAEPEARG